MKLGTVRVVTALLAFTLAPLPAAADMKAAHAAYGKLLAKYVTARGVKYAAWRASGDDLKTVSEVVMQFRSAEIKDLEPNERKALYINLYNGTVLELVLFQNPVGTIRALSKNFNSGEIFSRNVMAFDGKATSLNALEKRLRTEFNDPRTHFALNCASRSCPPLRTEAYVAARLDAQLDDAARAFLAAPGAVVVKTAGSKPTISVSKLFDWYADDFKASGGVLAFIAKYGPPEAAEAAASGKAKLEFQEYDWSLSAAN